MSVQKLASVYKHRQIDLSRKTVSIQKWAAVQRSVSVHSISPLGDWPHFKDRSQSRDRLLSKDRSQSKSHSQSKRHSQSKALSQSKYQSRLALCFTNTVPTAFSSETADSISVRRRPLVDRELLEGWLETVSLSPFFVDHLCAVESRRGHFSRQP